MPVLDVVTVSDRCHAGVREDTAGPLVQRLCTELMPIFEVSRTLIPDGAEHVRTTLERAAESGADVVLTLGGTGVSDRDQTPEATSAVLTRELPGIAELLRSEGREQTVTAVLSRGKAGLIDRTGSKGTTSTVVVNLAGSPGACEQGTRLLAEILPHLLAQLKGEDHG